MLFPSTTGETNSQSTLLAPTMITMEPGGIKLMVLGQSCLQNMTPQCFSLLHGVLQMQYYPQYMEEDIQSQSKCMLNTSTSSAMALASSMAANLSESEHVLFSPGFGQHTLYMARRTSGVPPEAVPWAKPPMAKMLGTLR